MFCLCVSVCVFFVMCFLSSLVVQIGEGDNWQRCLIARKWVCRLLVQSSIHQWLYAFQKTTRKQHFIIYIYRVKKIFLLSNSDKTFILGPSVKCIHPSTNGFTPLYVQTLFNVVIRLRSSYLTKKKSYFLNIGAIFHPPMDLRLSTNEQEATFHR